METKTEAAARRSFVVAINMFAWMILITAVGLGYSHFHECPVQPKLPVYMSVIGAAGLLLLLLIYVRNQLDEGLWATISSLFSLVLFIFTVCWFLAGTYWIYSIYPPNYGPTNAGEHCHRILYLFAFWFNNLCFMCVTILLVFCAYTFVYNCTNVFFRDRSSFSCRTALLE